MSVSPARYHDDDIDPMAGTAPGAEAYTPDDEDYVSDEERADLQALFRGATLTGAPSARQLAVRYKRAAQDQELLGPALVRFDGAPVELGFGDYALLALAVVGAGVVVGSLVKAWRRSTPKARDLVGLDVVLGGGR